MTSLLLEHSRTPGTQTAAAAGWPASLRWQGRLHSLRTCFSLGTTWNWLVVALMTATFSSCGVGPGTGVGEGAGRTAAQPAQVHPHAPHAPTLKSPPLALTPAILSFSENLADRLPAWLVCAMARCRRRAERAPQAGRAPTAVAAAAEVPAPRPGRPRQRTWP